MTWVKIDDQFYDHPKAIKAGRDGRDLFIAGLCHCAAQLTDGFIASEAVPLIAFKAGIPNAKKTAQILVSVGFWDTTDGGYLVHEYLEYNPSGDKIRADRNAAKERMGRKRSGERLPQLPDKTAPNSSDVRANNSRNSPDVRFLPSPSPSPSPDMYTNPSLDTTTTTLPGGMGGESSSRDEEQSCRLSSEGKDSSNTKNEKRDTIRKQFIEVTLTEHPDWKSPLDLTVQNASPDDETAYRTSVLRRWIGGDGTPPEPSNALVPAGQNASTSPRSPRFPPKETAEEINARVVNRLAGNGFFNSGGNPQ